MPDEEPGARMAAKLARGDAHRDMLEAAREQWQQERFRAVQNIRDSLAELGAHLDDIDEIERHALQLLSIAEAPKKRIAELKAENKALKTENSALRQKCAALELQEQQVEDARKLKAELRQAQAGLAQLKDLDDLNAQLKESRDTEARLYKELNWWRVETERYKNRAPEEIQQEKRNLLQGVREERKRIQADNQRLLRDARIEARRIVMDAQEEQQTRTQYWDELKVQRKQNEAYSKRISELQQALNEAQRVNGR
jgi:regulator of replication initiation timing